jgi:glycosyltransferase involved in cell wall biosynthesis
LRIAARVNAWERDFFDRTLASLLATPGVEFLGEVGDAEKKRLLAGARALLFPINWPEPFGLVMIEAMACGTPVIAFDRGAAAEVVRHEATGFVCGSVDEMVAAVRWVAELDRQACRARVAERFSADAMTGSYEAVYRALINRR